MSNYFEGEKIENQSWKGDKLTNYEYEYCSFHNCDFSDASVLSSSFLECTFFNCNFSLTILSDTTFNDTKFIGCKILGVKFNLCNDFIFKVSFADCVLDYCSFEKRKMTKTIFKDCSLKGVAFIETLLKECIFDKCNLDEAVFIGANLQETDFSTAYNYIINLDENFVRKTRFSKDGLVGLLRNYDIIVDDI